MVTAVQLTNCFVPLPQLPAARIWGKPVPVIPPRKGRRLSVIGGLISPQKPRLPVLGEGNLLAVDPAAECIIPAPQTLPQGLVLPVQPLKHIKEPRGIVQRVLGGKDQASKTFGIPFAGVNPHSQGVAQPVTSTQSQIAYRLVNCAKAVRYVQKVLSHMVGKPQRRNLRHQAAPLRYRHVPEVAKSGGKHFRTARNLLTARIHTPNPLNDTVSPAKESRQGINFRPHDTVPILLVPAWHGWHQAMLQRQILVLRKMNDQENPLVLFLRRPI